MTYMRESNIGCATMGGPSMTRITHKSALLGMALAALFIPALVAYWAARGGSGTVGGG